MTLEASARFSRIAVTTALAWAALLAPTAPITAQEHGAVVGQVVSARTGEPVPAVQVFVEGTEVNAFSGVDGRFMLRRVPAGPQHVSARSLGYAAKTIRDLSVPAGGTVRLDIALESQTLDLGAVSVIAAAERGSTAALLGERRRSATVTDAIGAEQIARSPDGNAGAALKRVPGVSLVDGKFAYVRGLGERYTSATLNGAPLASPVPDRKVIPLDVIPTALLESIVTAKSYSPDQSGDYAGGLVQLRTRAFPAERILRLSVSGSYDTEASLRTGLGYTGGHMNALGSGAQGLPAAVPRERQVTFGAGFSRAELAEIGQSFSGDWGPTAREQPMNLGLGLTYGDEVEVLGRRLGLLASGSWSNAFSSRTDQVERVYASQGAEPEVDYLGQSATRAVSVGGLLNASYKLTDTNQLTFAAVYNRLAEDEARQLQGFNLDSNTSQRNTRIRHLGQDMLNVQLSGDHVLGWAGNSALSWRGARTRASRYEPNTREVLYRQAADGSYVFDTFVQSGSIFHQDMVDRGHSAAVQLRTPFSFRSLPAALLAGLAADARDRDAYTRRFRFLPVPGGQIDDATRALPPNELFAPAHIHPAGFEIQEATFRPDNYVADERIEAGFLMLDLEPLPGVRLSGGARLERSRQRVLPVDLFAGFNQPIPGADLDRTSLLPALNVTVDASPNGKLRIGASRTLARPQLRELAPFSFADYAGGFLVVGNPGLELSSIDNLDVRYEWFFAPGELVALSGFHKRFTDPIEVLVLPSTELIKTWANAAGASNVGAEIELRTSLARFSGALERFAVNANLTLVASEVSTGSQALVYVPGSGPTTLEVTDRDRPLQGQSPYVVNAGLTYFDPASETSATLLFHRAGTRIDALGRETTPDILEEARNQLDLTLARALPGGVGVKLSASRLLGQRVEFTQGGQVVRSYDSGRSVSLSASLNF
jgi:TonB-dependent receptor